MYQITDKVTDLVKIEMTSGDSIVIELDGASAPITVENFKNLVAQHFYDGLIFHRVISGFMIQGGDPQGTGMGGSKQTIKGEFRINGVNNPISHERGVISMARSQYPNSASSQFFICHADAKFLDGQYAAFGRVVEGIETVDKIAAVPTNRADRPLYEQRMKSVYFVEQA
ncbi:MAG: peptidylprolyl isomerase [Clostridia bacterium]|nr:peptidylprolyl isomerase [Clostridia bacterium]